MDQIPISSANAPGASLAMPSPQNPQQQPPVNPFVRHGLLEEDQKTTIDTITEVCSNWAQDRMERIRVMMLNVMMEKGIQWVGWDQTSNCWFDALAELRNNGQVEDGESIDLERWMNNITLMFKQVFVGNLTRAVPKSVVRPANAEKPKDVQTAKAAEDLVDILDRKNKARKLQRTIWETMYSFGCYFRYTRPVLDGVENGYDEELNFTDLEIQTPARMKCMRCGLETPMEMLPQAAPGQMMQCPGCGSSMGAESYYAAGEGNRISLQAAGVNRVPRASVRQSIHSPLEVDLDPNCKEWWQTSVLRFNREINLGSALKSFPDYRDKIEAGASDSLSPNADWEKLMRTQERSVTSGYASDLGQQRPTYSMVWMNPEAYYFKRKYDYAARMEKAFPEGCLVEMIGSVCVGVRPAVMRDDWSSARLYESYGPYCPSIAERVVPFNQRFNAAMQMLDDWMQRSSTGINVMDGSRLDKQKVDKRPLLPGHVFEVPMRINGEARPLSETFMHYDLPMNPAAWSYPQMLLTFCELIAGLPPQAFGGGTQENVDTATGQAQMLSQATEGMQPYWENVKDECAAAAWNEVKWAKKLMQAGAMQKVWRAEEARGAGWRNKMVDWDQMQGEVEIYSDEDQGLPVTPDQLRQTFILMFQELSKGNPAAQEWFGVPSNADQVLSTMIPGSVSPVAAQITKTQMDIQILLQQPMQTILGPNGEEIQKLPVEPDKNFEDYTTAKECVRRFAIEECDLRFSNPEAWERLNLYIEQLEDMDAQVAAERAARQTKVNAAGQPPSSGPDPDTMAILQEVQQLGTKMVERLAQIAQLPPEATKGTAAAQVSAARGVTDAAIDLAKVMNGAK